MKRRDFLHCTGAASLISTGIISPVTLLAQSKMPGFSSFSELINNLIRLNDERIPALIDLQDRNPQSKYFGGVQDSFQIFNPGSTSGLITGLTCAFCSPQSKYFQDKKLTESIEKAAKYLLKIQHSDGTIDLLATNFHSTPDTGFVVEPLCAGFKLLNEVQFEGKKEVLGLLEEFFKKAGEAFITGGVHTPNHRWVVSMALARLNTLFPDERYLKRIDEWLREGIDIDSDGQYEERSTYIYTPLTNRCLVTMAKLLKREELLEPVRKNLEMTLFYIHPNGEIATEASGRQDQFQIGFMEHYYLPVRYMAIHDKNPQFSALVKQIEQSVPEKLSGYLVYFLEDSYYFNSLSSPSPLPDNYTKEFPHSNLARIRRENIDASLLGGNPTFFTLSKGNAVLASVRLTSAFFGRGQFKSSIIEKSGDSFVLKWEFHWGYFQPLPENQKPNYDIPFDEDRKRRRQSERQSLQAQIIVSEKEGIFELGFDLQGTENVPLAIEFAFRKGGNLNGVEKLNDPGTSLLKDGMAKYTFDNDAIEFGPGKAEHSWTAIRGALPKPDGECVYITGFTPFSHKLKIG
jgi:hypothetical protein